MATMNSVTSKSAAGGLQKNTSNWGKNRKRCANVP